MSGTSPDAPSPRPPSRPRLRRRLMIYLLVAIAVYVGVVLGIQRRVLFPRHVIPTPPSLGAPPGAQRLTLDTEAGPVEAWYVQSPLARPDRPGPLVIFTHGNAELIDDNIDLARTYVSHGMSVLMPEYRGYGRTPGSPSQKALTADVLAWYDRVTARPEIDGDRVIAHGRSLGGAVAAQLAAHRPVRGLILESTFTSVTAMARRSFVPSLLVLDPFDTLAVVRDDDGPVLVMHGTTDHIVPTDHARQLADAAAHSTLVLFDGGHNDGVPAEMYWNANDALLREAGVSPETPGRGEPAPEDGPEPGPGP